MSIVCFFHDGPPKVHKAPTLTPAKMDPLQSQMSKPVNGSLTQFSRMASSTSLEDGMGIRSSMTCCWTADGSKLFSLDSFASKFGGGLLPFSK